MKILAMVLIAYSAVMLVIHLTSWKLLEKWHGPENSWVKRRFPAQAALRVEAVYWLLVLASWPFWPSAGWKAMLVVFAVIHLGVWLADELRSLRSGAPATPPRKAHRFIVAFDLVEAGALVAIAWVSIFQVLRVG
jgi:hypothetical protein